ncbi:MAG: energy transducer TonB [Prevotella sp.]|jgi:protein TonB|nr:energy transducer TonB [Prevotella sp.]
MSKIDLFDQQWIDLVFEGKNESYGAYELRKKTSGRNLKAFIAMVLGIIAIVAIVLLKNTIQEAILANSSHEEEMEMAVLVEEKVEAEVERNEPVVFEQQEVVELVASSEKFTAPEITDEVPPEEVMRGQDDLAQTNTKIGVYQVEGNDEEAGEVLKAQQVVVTEQPKEEETKIFEVVEQMPSFPGGDAALMAFLSKNIKYPVVAEENGIQGRVIATFVVERDGSITDVKVVKSVDPSLDKEAVRVLKSMPKWIPGKQNGSAVRVKYTVPVTFRLQ